MRAIETRQKQIADGLAAGEQGRQELANAEKRDRATCWPKRRRKAAEIVAHGEKFKAETIEQAKIEAKAEADRIVAAAKAEIAAGSRAREGAAAQRGRRARGRRRVEDPEARGRPEGARRPAARRSEQQL